MSTKTDYTSDEWQVLKELPMLAGLAVMSVDKPTRREGWTLAQSVAAGGADYPQNQLVQALLQPDEWSEDEQQRLNAMYEGQALDAIEADIFAKAGLAMGILAAKSTPEEAADYRAWTHAVAVAVAKASKEGGFLGMGGERVSADEQALLDRLTSALGV